MSQKPNLFIIGAMKSGTTYLAKILNLHPSVFICDPEEPSYFVEPRQLSRVWPYMWEQGYWRSQEDYLRLFEAAGDVKIRGEASTNYAKRPFIMGIPEKLRRFNPDARLIYIMRDPVERTISHYWHAVRYDVERRPLLDAIKQEPNYRDFSYYAMQLEPFFEVFGREKIKILTLEELLGDTENSIKSVFSWLNVDPLLSVSPEFFKPENTTPEVVNVFNHFGGVERWMRQRRLGRLVNSFVPKPIRHIGAHFVQKIDRRTVDKSEVIRFLRPIQQRQTEELAHMLKRKFPEWNTLYSQSCDGNFAELGISDGRLAVLP